MKILIPSMVFASTLIGGCAYVGKWWTADEKKPEGVIELSYESPDTALAKSEEQEGIDLAIRKCTARGYTGAEPFSHEARTCSYRPTPSSSCTTWTVTREYRCTGGGADTKSK